MLGHICFGFIFFIFFIYFNLELACISPIMFYLGRERRDHEIKSNLAIRYWYKGWNIFKWSRDGQLDFWPVLIFYSLLYIILKFIM